MVSQIRKNACNGTNRLSQKTLMAMLPESQAVFFRNMNESTWSVYSWNPAIREACVLITTSIGTRLVTVTVPVLVVGQGD